MNNSRGEMSHEDASVVASVTEGWHGLSVDVMSTIIDHLLDLLLREHSQPAASLAPWLASMRASCSTWRDGVDACVQELRLQHLSDPAAGFLARFTALRALDLSRVHHRTSCPSDQDAQESCQGLSSPSSSAAADALQQQEQLLLQQEAPCEQQSHAEPPLAEVLQQLPAHVRLCSMQLPAVAAAALQPALPHMEVSTALPALPCLTPWHQVTELASAGRMHAA